MKKKYTVMLNVIALLLAFTIIVGGTYAYFAVTLNASGNNKKLNVVTEYLGSIKWTGTKVFTNDSLLPGEIGIQTFTVEKNSSNGKGIYEIDLNGVVDESFNNDIEKTLYKSTNTTKNNVSVTEGNTSMTGTGTLNVAKEDTLSITGTPEKVYGPKTFKTKNPIILEQTDFDNSTLQKTTYYLVYHYKNNGNQNSQQGKSFSGEINVKLILEKQIIETFKDKITSELNEGKYLIEDNYENIRYITSDPNNYVYFNCDDYDNQTSTTCELWRIIGISSDGSNVKIIRNDSIGAHRWNTGVSSSFDDSSLKEYLNNEYYNGNDDKYKIKNDTTRSLIIENGWKVRKLSSSELDYHSYVSVQDVLESGTTDYFYIGLINLVDYGYASNNEYCIVETLRFEGCKEDNWLYDLESIKQDNGMWTITGIDSSGAENYAISITQHGIGTDYNTIQGLKIHPVLYLQGEISIGDGLGIKENPYKLFIE